MRKVVLLAFLCVFLYSCSRKEEEEAIPVVVDFDYKVHKNDYSVPVSIRFTNKTQGADTYKWHFEGGIPKNSSKKNPGIVKFTAKGVYKISLEASNSDDSKDEKVIEIKIDAPVTVDFTATNLISTFSPATYKMKNLSTEVTSYKWTFEGGKPSSSTEKDPGEVIFRKPGKHIIKLEASNGRETYTRQKTVVVSDYLSSDFDYSVAFEDDDYQIPVKVSFKDKSVSVTKYKWQFQGANKSTSEEKDPVVIFNKIGKHTIKLTATNGKRIKTVIKTITVLKNTNLREFKNVKLGVSTTHNNDVIGSFFSLKARKVYTKSQLTGEIEKDIDLIFYGVNSTFKRNSFVSPDRLSETTFDDLQVAKKTLFINSLESCKCSAKLSVSEFDMMVDDTLFQNLTITETKGGLKTFNNTMVPRIVLFRTQEGKKGAIKIKSYHVNGENNSYILVDIRVQKESK